METKASETATSRTPESGLTLPQIVLIAAVIVGGLVAMALAATWVLKPPRVEENLARQAHLYLRQRKGAPFSEPLQKMLARPDLYLMETQPHSLLGRPAPDFTLKDHKQRTIRLADHVGKKPIVVIFYYGYWCDHCVAQLFGVHEDIGMFRELDAQVIAISADPPEITKERFEQYGEFAFPTVSDPDNAVAEAYDCTVPDDDGELTALHGTFVIGRDGVIHWANTGHRPFLGNSTLLYELAKLEGRLPEKE